jgi:hypothetical protein
MHKLFLPLAVVFAMSLFGTYAKADDVPDDFDNTQDDTFIDDADGSPAVPEPSAAFAMGAGLATIAFALRRRR